jgi:general secretion pathway protein F
MAAFQYRASNEKGQVRSGVIEASSAVSARQSLRAQGLLTLEMQESRARVQNPASGANGKKLRRQRGLSLQSLTLVTRQLATLLSARLRIDEALSTVAKAQVPHVTAILLTLRASVVEGRSFADALDQMPGVFSDFYRASVRAGEQAGQLDKVMNHIATFIESRARNRQTVQLALLYPALLAMVSLAIITMLMTFVVPDIVKVFTSRGAELPFLTRALIAISAFVRAYGLIAALGLIIAGLGFARWYRAPKNRLVVHRFLARWRLTGGVVRQMNASQIAGTLATLLNSTVPLVEALSAAADVTPNLFIRQRMAEVAEKVRQGGNLNRAMEEAAVFPPMMVAMVASGETSGRLADALDHAATDQQRSLDAWVKAVIALVEPAILLVMGGLVMAMVLAILLPIISLNGLVGK